MTNDIPDPARRIAELEAELEHVKKQRDMYKSSLACMPLDPKLDRPMTAEELHDMLHGPRGGSISEIIEEVRKIRG